MKKIIHSILIVPALLVVFSLFSGCYYDEVIPDTSIYSKADITWSGEVLPIFNSGCNVSGCHNTGGTAPDLSGANAYNALNSGGYIDTNNPEQSELYQWVNGNRATPMPLSGTDSKIASSILSWIQQGAQNN